MLAPRNHISYDICIPVGHHLGKTFLCSKARALLVSSVVLHFQMCFECLNMFALRSSQRICNAWTLETCPAHPCTVHVVDQDWALLIVAGSNCNGPSDELVSANVCYESHSYHIRMPQALQVASKQYPRTFQNFQWYKGRPHCRCNATSMLLVICFDGHGRRIAKQHRTPDFGTLIHLDLLPIAAFDSERRNLNGIMKWHQVSPLLSSYKPAVSTSCFQGQ